MKRFHHLLTQLEITLHMSNTMQFTDRELGLIAHLLGYTYVDLDTPNSGSTWTIERYGKDAVVGAFKKVSENIKANNLTKDTLEIPNHTRVPVAKESAFGLDRDFEVLGLRRKDHNKIDKHKTSRYC